MCVGDEKSSTASLQKQNNRMDKTVFPVLPEKPERNQWYRIVPEGAVTSDGMQYHASINIGTENKVLFMLHGGGVSWNEYMAARPILCEDSGKPNTFYFNNEESIADAITPQGISNKSQAENPCKDWTIINIPYSSGDFHCGTGDFPYTDQNGERKILRHHGYTNFCLTVEQIKTLLGNPEQIIVAGSSAGGSGAALMTDTVIRMFPGCSSFVSIVDSGFTLYDFWRDVAFKIWKTPQKIAERIHSNNIVLDSLQALKRENEEKVQILFACSVRDSVLSQFMNYAKNGELCSDYAQGIEFQKDLKEMCCRILDTIPGASVFIFDAAPESKMTREEIQNHLTLHTLLQSDCAYEIRSEGKTIIEWIREHLQGKQSSQGVDLLERIPE
ncbi:MAG TPA: hypothetical protein H9955_01850 [Candidatus Mediterraneibacter cottocaccae]|nr:hypothetical protein [Candidatus Mediterraneibacter cottocaccae]